MTSSGLSRGEAASLQQHGQKLYQQGNFKAAVDAFTEALKVKDVDVVGVLDVRAATYTKLSQYDQALRDAKHMIKKDKNDDRGYLRCAKALLLDGKPSKALEVYAYALKNLAASHPRRKVVEQLHDKLQDKLSEKCLDPFTVLPLEMAVMVLQHFEFKQIVAVLRVSRKWEQFLTSLRSLWLRMDLSGGRGKIPWTSVRAYLRRSKGMTTHAIIKNLAGSSSKKSLELLSRCPKLEYLEVWTDVDHNAFYDLFKGSKRLKTFVVSAHITVPQEHITKFLTGMPLLERVEFHSTKPSPSQLVQWPMTLPNLKSITLGSKVQSPSAAFTQALDIPGLSHPTDPHSIPNLEELRLDWNPETPRKYPLKLDSSGFSRLRRLDLSGIRFDGNFGLPSTLESIRIRRGSGITEFPFSIENRIELPKLRTLILSDVPWVTTSTLHILFVELEAPIRVLHVDSCFNLGGSQLEMLTPSDNFSALEELNVSYINGFDDRVMGVLANTMADLKVINLSYTAITGCTIKMLADARSSEGNSAKVDRIVAKGCEDLSSDAVAYARAKGIEIFT